MDKVIIYSRVSTDEQKETGFSLRDQLDKLQKHCIAKNYNVVNHFQDDYSAKTFNRPAFKDFLSFVKSNKGHITRLVFIKWDRFSRNATEALFMIRELGNLGITCEAIEQPLDLSIPENKLMLMIYLSTPEIENDRRSLNVIMGMRRAMKEGRFCSTAPFGYKYLREERRKPILIPDGLKAGLIREAFELYATGHYSKEAVRRMLVPKGMTLKTNRFSIMFHDRLYCGQLLIKRYKNEPEELVQGVHEAIITEELYYEVQAIASGIRKIQSKPNTLQDELPLRGYLTCHICGQNLTGSASRSKTGARHFYYHCRSGCNTRFRADVANNCFEDWLEQISLKPEYTDEFLKSFDSLISVQKGDRKKELASIEAELQQVQKDALEASKMLVRKEIDMETYQQLKISYTNDENRLKAEKEKQADINLDILAQIEFGLNIMSNLRTLWIKLALEEKRTLLNLIFTEKLIFENGRYRTPIKDNILAEILNDNNGLGESQKEKTAISDGNSLQVVPARIHLYFVSI